LGKREGGKVCKNPGSEGKERGSSLQCVEERDVRPYLDMKREGKKRVRPPFQVRKREKGEGLSLEP